jgi:ribosomal protein S18 acetylase RimI-like enzyme
MAPAPAACVLARQVMMAGMLATCVRVQRGWKASAPPPPLPGAAEPEPVGVLLATRHFPSAAEIHLLAVDPSLHRRGVGRALVAALEADLIADGVKFLQVKTLGPTSPDEGYARTRKFYTQVGFQPLEELHNLWPGNPCLIMIKSLPPRPP